MAHTIEIRRATAADAQGIYNIYRYWEEHYVDAEKTKRFFTLKNPYTVAKIERIVAESEAVVAVADGQVVSFYFTNPFFDPGDLAERKAVVERLIANGTLPAGRYATCLLSSTAEPYQGRGLNAKTLHLLREISKAKYDYFAGIMAYHNHNTHASSLKMGWKHYGDVGIGLLAIIATDSANTALHP
ncbi:hypothetical protein [Hymenobacter cheonanensis]|uniref:hypothetical protein n=1 Tax=Hymenobacter sp. CA2-7 TaxID=3063993 RepID=UPI002712DC25|nr:hypothetical protein [Hymenobacter sp. CA2-7]MDO7886639.1 hypothetical protein [Hymenobacter sp. CA2-7]